jgi:hypothetical protein
MQAKSLKTFDHRIQRIQAQLAQLGPLRPGTLSRQYRRPEQRQGAYYQLSYTYQMKSHTEYVPKSQVGIVRQEIAVYQRYKKLTAQWIDLALQRSRLRMQLARPAAARSSLPQGRSRTNLGGSILKNPGKSHFTTDHEANIRRPK